ncbi:hypothetical protein [Paraburkholderia sp. GAS42]|uniref:hypothetical protein n=1 Tax=Paraburkholderia sp. GAS42 TaxID=3035135 RepID=UPI003D249DF7
MYPRMCLRRDVVRVAGLVAGGGGYVVVLEEGVCVTCARGDVVGEMVIREGLKNRP